MQYLTVTVLTMLQQQAQRQEKWVSRHQFAPSPPTFHRSTVECRPPKLNRFKSTFWYKSNRIGSKLFWANWNALVQTGAHYTVLTVGSVDPVNYYSSMLEMVRNYLDVLYSIVREASVVRSSVHYTVCRVRWASELLLIYAGDGA